MDWDEMKAATLLLSEERVGVRVRSEVAQEDAEIERSKAILRAEERMSRVAR